MNLSPEDIQVLNKELKKNNWGSVWGYVRFRKSTTGKGYVLHRVHKSLKDKVLSRLFESGAKIASPIHCHGEHYAIHFTCSHELAVKLAGTFPPLKYEELIPISKDGTKVLTGLSATKAINFQTLQYAA